MTTAAEKYSNVTLSFNHKLTEGDLENGTLKFLNTITHETFQVNADLIIGADGAYSTVRKIMMKQPGFDFSQTYIKHGYIELNIPPRMIDKNDPAKGYEFSISPSHFHIWPRGTFMMIAMPNDDFSFTGNLFAPLEILNGLNTPENIMKFFKDQFPDVLLLLEDHQELINHFLSIKPKPLISIKATPYHTSKSLLLGDAAHAMVPFYGQGMNSAFEDVLILNELMDLYDEDMSQVLPAFSKKRCSDAHAICDLAMYNYVEMRDLVLKKSFLIRRNLDSNLHKLWPNSWIPLYFMITFTRIGFRDCIALRSWQDKIVQRSLWFLGTIATLGALIISIMAHAS
ncbi:hypothetical protein PV325_006198 [Microctonus aethiopoides]|nr:hypothetical protein PV325_006198 [Microctonus aethiopoides]